jgi:mRNA interferase HigB
MRVIAKRTLLEFVASRRRHADHTALQGQIAAWYAEVRQASWPSMAALNAQFRNASVISSDRVVFNIKGNDYRLIVAFDFETQIAFIKWIGTHADYDKIDARSAQNIRRHSPDQD